MIRRKVALELFGIDVSDLVALTLTMIVGMTHMLPLPEMVKILAGGIFVFMLLMLPAVKSVRYLMFVLNANELLDIGTTSLTMIFVAVFSIKHCFCLIKNKDIDATVFIGTLFLFIFGVIVYLLLGTKDSLIGIVKHIFFMYFTAKVLDESKGEWRKLYIDIYRYVALGAIYFTMLSIAIQGLPALSKRFTPAGEITINFFGIICALAIVNLLYGILKMKASVKINVCLIAGCVVCGLLTQSRTFILAVAIGVVLMFLFTTSVNMKCYFMAAGVAVSILLYLVYTNIPVLAERIDSVLFRFLDPSGGDISNGRYDLWSYTIASMINNPIYFWFGAGNHLSVGAAFDDRVMVAHNMFLETWVIYGVVGCIMLFIVYVLFIKRYLFMVKNGRVSLISLVPLIVMLCSLFYSHHFIGRSMSLVFAFSFLPIAVEKMQEGSVSYP